MCATAVGDEYGTIQNPPTLGSGGFQKGKSKAGDYASMPKEKGEGDYGVMPGPGQTNAPPVPGLNYVEPPAPGSYVAASPSMFSNNNATPPSNYTFSAAVKPANLNTSGGSNRPVPPPPPQQQEQYQAFVPKRT